MRGLVFTLMVWLASCGATAADNAIIIIAHPTVPAASVGAQDLANIYLLKTAIWPNGVNIIPVNREAASELRSAFSEIVLKQPPRALAAYWNEMHFKGKTPPLIQQSDQAVATFVRNIPGAIGYVSSGADTAGTKVMGSLP